MAHNIVDILKEYDRKKSEKNKGDQRAVVVAVTPTSALIRTGGSNQLQESSLGSYSVSVGDRVIITENTSRSRLRWVITAITERSGSNNIGGVERAYTEIHPPSNVTVSNEIAGVITVSWDVPIVYPVVVQIQTTEDYNADPEQASVTTRGSYAIISSETTQVRARVVAPDGQKSAWTSWLDAVPASISSAINGTVVTYEGEPVTYNGYFLMFDLDTELVYTLEE